MLKLPTIKTLARCRSANCTDSSVGVASGTSRSACTSPDSSESRSSTDFMTSLFPKLPILRSSKSATNLSTARSETDISDASGMIDVRTFLLQMAAEQEARSLNSKPRYDKGAESKNVEAKGHRACCRLRSEMQLRPGNVKKESSTTAYGGGRRSAPGDQDNPITDVKTFLLQMAEQQQKADDSTKNSKSKKARNDSGKRSPKKYLIDHRGSPGDGALTLQTPAYPADRRRLSPVILFSNVEAQEKSILDQCADEFSTKDDNDDGRPSPVALLEKCADGDRVNAGAGVRRTRSLSPDEFFPLVITD